MKNLIVYLDMDGVLTDFDKRVEELLGCKRDQRANPYDWERLSEWHDTIFATLDKLPDADELVDGIMTRSIKYRFEVGVLTALPSKVHWGTAKQQKKAWINRHYQHLLSDFNVGPYARDKQKHCRPGDVLIDDSTLNIPQWISKGGHGILHTNAKDSLASLDQYLLGLRDDASR